MKDDDKIKAFIEMIKKIEMIQFVINITFNYLSISINKRTNTA